MIANTLPDIATLSISSNKDYLTNDNNTSGFNSIDNDVDNTDIITNDDIIDLLDSQGVIPETLIERELSSFVQLFHDAQDYKNFLGYFVKNNDLLIKIITLIYLKKIESGLKAKHASDDDLTDDSLTIHEFLETDEKDLFVLINSSSEGLSVIDKEFLDSKTDSSKDEFHLESFNTTSKGMSFVVVSKQSTHLIKSIANSKIVEEIKHAAVEVKKASGPFLKFVKSSETKENQEFRLIVSFKRGTTTNFYQLFNQLLDYYEIKTHKSHLETYTDDFLLFSFYFTRFDNEHITNLDTTLNQILRETSLIYCLPITSDLVQCFQADSSANEPAFVLSPQEKSYFKIASSFIYHFIDRLSFHNNGANLISSMSEGSSNEKIADILTTYQQILKQQSFSEQLIASVLSKHKKLVVKLFKNFALVHYPKESKAQTVLDQTLSYQRILNGIEPFHSDEEFFNYLKASVDDQSPDFVILKTLKTFNDSILKTNFFMNEKLAISFRLDPKKIFQKESLIFPEVPFAVFFVTGSHFHGFHIRFHDIARGGIRIVKSPTSTVYNLNLRSMLEENYNLAYTQQKKNKDIPESGSKGVILMKPGFVSEKDTKLAFEKYCDAIIDILDFNSEKYVDLYGKREILFFGPDENTAGFCDFATLYAKSRGCSWWKSFLTGKSHTLGGIPHDKYGMTSISVRTFVESVYNKLGLNKEGTVLNKFQTGGPDGDLGSNEILLSSANENYVGLVDGSGTLVDINGINKPELIRLAKSRSTVDNFNRDLLSKDGFFVSINDKDVTLPNGEVIADGLVFRNKFHSEYLFQFLPKIDVFVPCGGRPASININNIELYIDSKTGKSRIPIIVEGANLFITQDCRLKFEHSGAILVKDSSANKGGVTSSSLEVLASLALDDNDFVNKFVKNDSAYYDKYVKFIQAKIHSNAAAEFEQLWNLNKTTGTPISILSDELSVAINKLNSDLIDCKELFENDLEFRNHLLIDKIIPPVLFEVSSQSKEQVVANIPENYADAMLSVYIASSYVYKYGIDINMGKFLGFINELKKN